MSSVVTDKSPPTSIFLTCSAPCGERSTTSTVAAVATTYSTPMKASWRTLRASPRLAVSNSAAAAAKISV